MNGDPKPEFAIPLTKRASQLSPIPKAKRRVFELLFSQCLDMSSKHLFWIMVLVPPSVRITILFEYPGSCSISKAALTGSTS